MSRSTARLQSLQCLRGIAAVLVVAMHTGNLASAFSRLPWTANLAVALQHVGHFGVDLFFVLSGFVISRIAMEIGHGQVSRVAATRAFIRHRFLRIYPLFWLSLIVMLFLPAVPGADNSLATLAQHPGSLLLLQGVAAHPVGWTLVYEIQFYIVAALLVFIFRASGQAFLAWVAAEVVLIMVVRIGGFSSFPLVDALTLEFCAGIIVGMLYQRVKIPAVPCALLSAAAALLASLKFGPNSISVDTPLRMIVWGMPAAVLVWAFVSAERNDAKFPSGLVHLGNISYSLYMWHLAVLTLLATLMLPIMDTSIGACGYVLISGALMMLISNLSFELFEERFRTFARRPARSSSQPDRRPPGDDLKPSTLS